MLNPCCKPPVIASILLPASNSSAVTPPNTFTPNGDGVNDLWNIPALNNYPGCLITIYNRYGSLIYQSRGYAKPWDGRYKGSNLPAGTYYYVIDLSPGNKKVSGYIAVLR